MEKAAAQDLAAYICRRLPVDVHNLVTLARFQCCHRQAVDPLFIGSTVAWESQAGITTPGPGPALPVLPRSSLCSHIAVSPRHLRHDAGLPPFQLA